MQYFGLNRNTTDFALRCDSNLFRFSPPVVALIGPKWSMFLGGIGYFLFIISFLKPMTWALYLGSVIVGLAAPIIWTGNLGWIISVYCRSVVLVFAHFSISFLLSSRELPDDQLSRQHWGTERGDLLGFASMQSAIWQLIRLFRVSRRN